MRRVNNESRVILDAEVTTGGRHDNQPYLEQLRRVEDRCHCTIQEATADRGYGSAEILKALKAKGAKTYIPLWHGRSGRNSGAAVGMNYEREQDRIRCPAGKYLYPRSANYENRRRFVSLPAACRGCSLASSCPAKARPHSPHTRFVLRPMDQDLFDEVQAQMNEPDFGKKVIERIRTIQLSLRNRRITAMPADDDGESVDRNRRKAYSRSVGPTRLVSLLLKMRTSSN